MLKLCFSTLYAAIILSAFAIAVHAEDKVFVRGSNAVDEQLKKLLDDQEAAKAVLNEATEKFDLANTAKTAVEKRIEKLTDLKKAREVQQAAITGDVENAKTKLAALEKKIGAKRKTIDDAKAAATTAAPYDESKDEEELEKLLDIACSLRSNPKAAMKLKGDVLLSLGKEFGDEILRRGGTVTVLQLLKEAIAELQSEIDKLEATFKDTTASTDPFTSDPIAAKKGLKTLFLEAESVLKRAQKAYDDAINAVERYMRTKATIVTVAKLDSIAEATTANTKAIVDLTGVTKDGFANLTKEVKGIREETAKAAVALANIPMTKEESELRDKLLNRIVELLEQKKISEAQAAGTLDQATKAATSQVPPPAAPPQEVSYYSNYQCQGTDCKGGFYTTKRRK